MAGTKSREGKVIGGGRKCGKTTELIKKASKEGLYILCPNKNMARIIFKQAKDMGLNIPHPITVEDLPLRSVHIDEVLIDEVEIVLQKLIGKRVAGMSTTMPMEELPAISNNKPSMTIKPPREVRPKSVGELTIDVDCSEALKGLKAIQREARKATQALKELEVQKKSVSLFPDHKCRRCGENKLTLKSLGENIKGIKSVCKDCGARQ